MIFRLAFFLGINPNLFNNQIRCNMAINIHKILSDTLLELCKEKKLQSITVQDILKRSGVSRQAFYNRFRDKYELIQWTYLHNILCDFLNNGPYGSYYLNTLNYYRAINNHRDFMRQACQISGQNCLKDYIYNFAINYDLEWHRHLLGVEKLPPEIEFITWYHAAASIDMVLRWIFSDKPESPELMATRITNVRRLSMSSMLFGLDSRIYDITDSYDYQAYEPDFHSRLMNDPE